MTATLPWSTFGRTNDVGRAALRLAAVSVLSAGFGLAGAQTAVAGPARPRVVKQVSPASAIKTLQRQVASAHAKRAAACRHAPAGSQCRLLRRQERKLEVALKALQRTPADTPPVRTPGPTSPSTPPAPAPTPGNGSTTSSSTPSPGSPPAAVPAQPVSPDPAPSAPPTSTDPAPSAPPTSTDPAPSAPPTSTAPIATGPRLYVDPAGSDSGSGDAAHPFATLTKALAAAAGGETIVVAPGHYPKASDTRARSTWVTLQGPGNGQAVVDGLAIAGGQWLRVGGLSFDATVSVRWSATLFGSQPASHIDIHDDDLTGPGTTCLQARDGATDVAIQHNTIHDCEVGFGAAAGGSILQSTGLTISDNSIEHLTGDAIQLGQWNDVAITGNTIDDMFDPAATYHNDGVQLTGNVNRIAIDQNTITNSRNQLIFIQDAIGPIDDVTVENNVLANAGSVALQSLGATNARYVGNTIWGGKAGGLWIGLGSVRSGQSSPKLTTDSIVVNNVLSDFERRNGTSTAIAAGNVVPCPAGQSPSTSELDGVNCVSVVGFTSVTDGDYRLLPSAPARGLGSSLFPLQFDRDGAERASQPVPGAYR